MKRGISKKNKLRIKIHTRNKEELCTISQTYKIPFSSTWIIIEPGYFNKFGVMWSKGKHINWFCDAISLEEAKEKIKREMNKVFEEKKNQIRKYTESLDRIKESKDEFGEDWMNYWKTS